MASKSGNKPRERKVRTDLTGPKGNRKDVTVDEIIKGLTPPDKRRSTPKGRKGKK